MLIFDVFMNEIMASFSVIVMFVSDSHRSAGPHAADHAGDSLP